MLKSLDVLIGLALVMLVVSMVVTILTQSVMTALNAHGKNLRQGLQHLLSQTDPGLTPLIAKEIADCVLRHPLIGAQSFLGFFRLGTVIHRHELTKILLELATPDCCVNLESEAKEKLRQALTNNGIQNPAAVLDTIRTASLTFEKEHPEFANNVRADMAILQNAETKFVGKINGWFDQTIDRVIQRFTVSARLVSFLCAMLVAVAIQLDAVNLLNTLWTNDIVRQDLVAEAAKLDKHGEGSPDGLKMTPEEVKFDQQDLQKLSSFALNGLIVLPWMEVKDTAAKPASSPSLPVQDAAMQLPPQTSSVASPPAAPSARADPSYEKLWTDWRTNWKPDKVPGILLSGFLLSLGAPFWYNSLKTLLRMRSELSDKDDEQRDARESDGAINPKSAINPKPAIDSKHAEGEH